LRSLAVLLLLLFTLWGVVKLYEDEIKAQIIKQLNTQLLSPVKVSGPIYVSLFEIFPHVSLSFRQLELQGLNAQQQPAGELAKIDRLSLSFSLLDLFRKKYELQELHIHDAAIELTFDANGHPNFVIWKTDSSRTTDNTSFAIKKLRLQRVKLHYNNAADGQDLGLSLSDADFKGDFSQRNFRLQARATLSAGSLNYNKRSYLQQQDLKLAMAMQVDLESQELRFVDSELALNKEKLQLNGYHRWLHPQRTELSFTAAGFDAESLFGYFKHQNNWLHQLAIAGEVAMSGKLSLTEKNSSLEVEGQLGQLAVNYAPYQLKFKGSSRARAYYSSDRGLQLQFTQLQLQNNNEQLTGQLLYHQQSELFETQLSGHIQLQNWQLLADSLSLGTIQGKARLEALQIRYKSGWPLVGGKWRLENFSWQKDDQKLSGQQLSLSTSGHEQRNLQIEPFALAWNDHPIRGKLTIYNYPALWLAEEGRYSLSGQLQLEQFNWLSGNNTTQSENAISRLEQIDLQLQAKKLQWADYNFHALQIGAKGPLNRLNLRIDKLQFAQGNYQGQLRWDELGNVYHLHGQLIGQEAPVKQLFSQLNNFDQAFITDKNLAGELDFNSYLSLYFDKNYRLLLPRAQLSTRLRIRQGQLNQFAPLQALARYVDAKELQQLRFTELNNEIRIADNRLELPEMSINTNAAAMRIRGQHSFDNQYTYYIQLNLSDAWQKRQKKIDFDPNLAETDPQGGVKLYLVIRGKGNDFVVEYDKLQVKTQFKENLRQSGQDIARLLKEEFSGQGEKAYENDQLDAISPIEVAADTLEKPKEPEFDPVYLRKPKSRKDAFKREKP
jgi:uncharacterized protein involved in outer membrane biogenesis